MRVRGIGIDPQRFIKTVYGLDGHSLLGVGDSDIDTTLYQIGFVLQNLETLLDTAVIVLYLEENAGDVESSFKKTGAQLQSGPERFYAVFPFTSMGICKTQVVKSYSVVWIGLHHLFQFHQGVVIGHVGYGSLGILFCHLASEDLAPAVAELRMPLRRINAHIKDPNRRSLPAMASSGFNYTPPGGVVKRKDNKRRPTDTPKRMSIPSPIEVALKVEILPAIYRRLFLLYSRLPPNSPSSAVDFWKSINRAMRSIIG
jgi:hypothetical protein